MAISRKTQKDVGKYQAKLVGPFTIRQTIYVGIAAVFAILLWNVTSAFQVDTETRIMLVICVTGPIALLGFLNPYGMTCLEFIKQYYEYHILSTKIRTFQTVTDDEKITQQEEKQNHSNNSKKEKAQQKKIEKKKRKEKMHITLIEYPEYL